MSEKYIIAHDVGTSGSKAVLIDLEGNVCATDSEKYNTYYPCGNWAEQEPEDYWRAISVTTKRVIEKGNVLKEDILGMIYSTQVLSIIPISKDGRVLRRAISWIDGRAEVQAQKIMKKFGGKAVFSKITGAVLSGKDGLAKLLWLKENESNVYKEMECFLDVNGYLTYKATGNKVMEWSCASAFGFDLKKKDWMRMVIKHIGLDESKFPPLVRSTDKVGSLTKEASKDCGLLEGTPIFGGAGDMQSAAIGSGSIEEGDAHIYLGTSAWVGISTCRYKSGNQGVFNFQSADPSKCLVVGEMESAGACLKWVADQFYKNEQEDPNVKNVFELMDKSVLNIPPGSNYLICTPWIYGERCPIMDTSVRSTFFNISAIHKREHMLKAIYEGVAYNLRWIIEIIENIYGFNMEILKVVGGGSMDKEWMQIIADVTQRRIETMENPQMVGAIGTALIAAIGLGVYKDFSCAAKLTHVNHIYTPNKANKIIYEDIFKAYKELYPSLKKLYREVNSIRFRSCTSYKE
ncbi:FGGY-family carbohydrate kinase [Haloimpatiens sp. FM7315]|uniref:xylulokinase n=1 Tax=Haloimpatiens sp. FM7315 TaxID=3298609 RepID=UPI0035A3317A